MEKKSKLSTQPYKGARDFYPAEMRVRNYIFDKWRKVCRRYGYEEYDGPLLENFEIYAAKTGEEIVNEQLYWFEDKADRKVAIRPEMTPTLARMVAQKFKVLPHPIRWFTIPNLWRYEAPQRGRLREHYQLNVDILGVEGVEADAELLNIYLDIMKEFGATEDMFEIRIGNRKILESVFKSLDLSGTQGVKVSKLLDKKCKMSQAEFEKALGDGRDLSDEQVTKIKDFVEDPTKTVESLAGDGSEGAREVAELVSAVGAKNLRYDPTVIRGMDYYTGNVFELYDLNKENPRSISGGGRYDDLVSLFVDDKIPANGFGLGDVTFRDFLETWNLLPQLETETKYLVTLWPNADATHREENRKIAEKLRKAGQNCELWLETDTKLDKQLKYADRKQIPFVIIFGEEEKKSGRVTVKNMKEQTQDTIELAEIT